MSQYQRNLIKLNNIPGSSLSQAAKNRNKIIFNLQNTFKDGKYFPEILHIVVDKRSITGKTGNISTSENPSRTTMLHLSKLQYL